MWAVLRRRDFGLVWASGLISDTGDWLLMIGLPIYVFTVTGSSLVTSAVFLLELVPALLLGSFAGVLIDRWDRRRTMVLVNLVQALLLLPMLAAGPDRLWIVYAVAGIEGTLAQLFDPARAALLPTLVGLDQLAAANSLTSMHENLARLLGSPLGGLTIVALGLPGVVILDAATFVVAAGLVFLVRTPGQVTSEQPDRIGLLGQWREGLGAVRRSRRLVGVFVVGGLTAFAQGIFLVLFVVFVERQLGASGAAVGLIRGFQAVGGIVGSILVGALALRTCPARLAGWGALLLGLLALGGWNLSHLTTEVAVYCVLFAVVGMPVAAYTTGLITTAQVASPPNYRGRVFGAFGTAEGGATAIGLAVGGLLGDRLGVVPVLDVQALLYVFAGLLSFRLLAAGPDFSQPTVAAVSATHRAEKPPRDSTQAVL